MRITTFILGISLLTLNACVSKSDYEKLENEKIELESQLKETKIELESQLEETKQELSNVSYKFNQLSEEKRQAEIKRNKHHIFPKTKLFNISRTTMLSTKKMRIIEMFN